MKVIVSRDNTILYEAKVSDEDLLNAGELFIGRQDDCHIVLESFLISRYHASLKIDQNELFIECLSDQGIMKVDGQEVKKKSLRNNSKIEIHDFQISISEIPLVENIDHEPSVDEVLDVQGVETLESAFEDSDLLSDAETPLETGESLDELDGDLTEELEQEEDLLAPETELEDLDDGSEELDDELIDTQSQAEDIDEMDRASLDFEEDNFSEDNFGEESTFADDDFGESDNFEQNDEFSDDDSFEQEDNSSTQVLQNFASYSLKIFGEFAPFDSYVLSEPETFIGRDPEKCQIVLEDEEVSKIHAVIKKSLINCIVEDLDSSNGIILNGERVNRAELTHNDEFIIGETTFTVSIESDIIEAERGRLMPVASNQEIEIVEEIEEEVGFDEFGGDNAEGFGEVEEKSFLKKIWKDPKKRKIYMGVGVLLLVLFLLDSEDEGSKKKVDAKPKKKMVEEKSKYSQEQLNSLEQDYALALSQYENGQFNESMSSLDSVIRIDPNYKNTQTIKKLLQEGLDEIARLKQQEQEEKEKKERQVKVANYLEKARAAVKERNVTAANNFFALIFELDPENIDVPALKIEIEAYQAEELRKKQEIEIEKARRAALVEKLAPGKALYLKKDFYKAIDRLEKFIALKNVDEDLLKEATKMLTDSRNSLKRIIGPLTSKARSFKEGQDLKQAYETYGEVLKIEPSNEEALNERDLIVDTLRTRSMKVYREALIAESLSLFEEAKEKFQEVQQVSPINSEYFIKATDKLKNYLE